MAQPSISQLAPVAEVASSATTRRGHPSDHPVAARLCTQRSSRCAHRGRADVQPAPRGWDPGQGSPTAKSARIRVPTPLHDPGALATSSPKIAAALTRAGGEPLADVRLPGTRSELEAQTSLAVRVQQKMADLDLAKALDTPAEGWGPRRKLGVHAGAHYGRTTSSGCDRRSRDRLPGRTFPTGCGSSACEAASRPSVLPSGLVPERRTRDVRHLAAGLDTLQRGSPHSPRRRRRAP